MSDPYIPLENELRLTRQCLTLIEKYGFGVSIQTKSARILRDMDILQAIHKKTKCVVQTTLTTYDEALCKIIEPHVSTSQERFSVLQTMQKAGIPTIVWLGPILPFINDTEENLTGLLRYCIEAGVKGILCFGFGVTMREGNREHFYRCLDQHFPGMKQAYITRFGNSYVCDSPNAAGLSAIFTKTCTQHGILHHTNEIFDYLALFETPTQQLSIFPQP